MSIRWPFRLILMCVQVCARFVNKNSSIPLFWVDRHNNTISMWFSSKKRSSNSIANWSANNRLGNFCVCHKCVFAIENKMKMWWRLFLRLIFIVALQWINRLVANQDVYSVYYTHHTTHDTRIEINHCINLKVNMIVMHHQIWWEFNRINHRNNFTILKINPIGWMDGSQVGFFYTLRVYMRSIRFVSKSRYSRSIKKNCIKNSTFIHLIPSKEFNQSEKTSQLTFDSQHSMQCNIAYEVLKYVQCNECMMKFRCIQMQNCVHHQRKLIR